MTDDRDLDEIRKRYNAATPGPWHTGHIDENLDHAEVENPDGLPIANVYHRGDEGLIVSSRTDIECLEKEIRLARAIVRAASKPVHLGHACMCARYNNDPCNCGQEELANGLKAYNAHIAGREGK